MACLKDLKKWLKLYDEKADRLDVARCLAEANAVEGDLLEILASWPESALQDRMKSKIALACVELLVPLTWPIEKNDAEMTVNHHRHVPYLKLAQASYKRAILKHRSGSVLRKIVQTGLPSIAMPIAERTPRDEGIIKLILYLFRNLATISPSRVSSDKEENREVSRSSNIEVFHKQDVLALLLTISSNTGEDFNTQDTIVMEVLFHLLKGVDVESLFMDKKQLSDKNHDELKALLGKEANMHRSYLKNAPTRHNRFGTMIWVKRDGAGRHSTVSGQEILKSNQRTLTKMDHSKKWNKPKQRSKEDQTAPDRFDMPVSLTESSRLILKLFVEEFLDSAFNPLFNHIRRAMEREGDRVLDSHKQQYFYLVSWFLEAERARRRQKNLANNENKDNRISETFEPDSFGLVASVLIQEFFVLLNRFMQNALDLKAWRELQAGMRCFSQILLIVQEMSQSTLPEDQEIAENIQNRIFYEEVTHDRILAILKGYNDQGFGYLDTCTELAHTFLRMLELYSRQNVNLHIRSKRRVRKSKKPVKAERVSGDDDGDEASDMEEVREAERVSKERKFDFTRFSAKFFTQGCVDTFVSFIKFFNDLSPEQLKRAHRFFYRVAFKQDYSVMLFRVDIIALFSQLVTGPEGLDPKNPVFREWEELVRQIIKKLMKKLNQQPEIFVELLFSKISSTTFYLEHGYEKQTVTSRSRPPAPLEVKGSMTFDKQIGVMVAILYHDHMDYVQWISQTLAKAADERQSWENEATARCIEQQSKDNGDSEHSLHQPSDMEAPSIVTTAPSEGIRIATFKDAKLRLLMSLSGFERLGDEDKPNAIWIIPSPLSASQLRNNHRTIEKHLQNPIFYYGEDEPIPAEDMVRRSLKEMPSRAEYDDDSESSDTQGGEEFLFPAGGPTNTANSRELSLNKLKKQRRKRRTDDETRELDDETLKARRVARAKADIERRRGIKSEQFVHDSDEEDDEERDREFFAHEEKRRLGQRAKVLEALSAGRVVGRIEGENIKPFAEANIKRKTEIGEERSAKKIRTSKDVSSDDGGEINAVNRSSSPARRFESFSSGDEEGDEDTPLSSPPQLLPGKISLGHEASTTASSQVSQSEDGDKLSRLALAEDRPDADEELKGVAGPRRRPRVAVFDDSDDD